MPHNAPAHRADPALTLLRSPLLAGAPHAFTTRRAGCSSPPFDSLNFGNPSELAPHDRDPPANIRANLRAVAAAIDPPAGVQRTILEVHQVHGGEVRTVRAGDHPPTGPTPRADAIVTDDPTLFAAVRVADCAPVLLASHDGRIVAAVHAGWRGVIARVAANAVAAMRGLGARDIRAAVGPCIGPEEFEVGPEVAAEFSRAFGADRPIARPAPERGPGKTLIDLKLALRTQLEAESISAIDVLPHCTVRDADLFFSHRRDKGITGRMIGIIGPRAG